MQSGCSEAAARLKNASVQIQVGSGDLSDLLLNSKQWISIPIDKMAPLDVESCYLAVASPLPKARPPQNAPQNLQEFNNLDMANSNQA